MPTDTADTRAVSYARRRDPEARVWMWVLAFCLVSVACTNVAATWYTRTHYTPLAIHAWPFVVPLIVFSWRVWPRPYRLSDNTFRVPFGPFTVGIPLADVVSVRSPDKPRLRGRSSGSLPCPKLAIRWRGLTTAISPQRPWQVLHDLEARCPHLVLQDAKLRLRAPIISDPTNIAEQASPTG